MSDLDREQADADQPEPVDVTPGQQIKDTAEEIRSEQDDSSGQDEPKSGLHLGRKLGGSSS
jgi:hypothetical protein